MQHDSLMATSDVYNHFSNITLVPYVWLFGENWEEFKFNSVTSSMYSPPSINITPISVNPL